MARVFDLVEYPDAPPDELVHRIPEDGSGDFRLGSQLVVRESQAAVFFKDGKAVDLFRPGRYTLVTKNIPLLINAVGALFDGKSPFTAEAYFVNTRLFVDQKWGTPQPITLRDKELGMVRLRAFGTYSMQIQGPRLFVGNIGARGLYQTGEIQDFLRGIIVTRLTDLLGSTLTTIFDLPQQYDELSAAIPERIKKDFADLGIQMRSMYVESITPTEEVQKAIDERSAMGAVGNLDAYLQFKAARALQDAASQPGGDAGQGVGLIAGLGLGGTLAGALTRRLGQPPEPEPVPAIGLPAAVTVVCPACQAGNPEGARFCLECGSRLEQELRCAECQTVLPAGARFCLSCGARVVA